MMTGRKKSLLLACLFLAGLLGFCACGSFADSAETEGAGGTKEIEGTEAGMELAYAENFSVDYLKNGCTLLTTEDARILVVPEDKEVPEGLDEDLAVIKRPVKKLYLVASAAMDMFDALDAVDTISFSGQEEDGWYIPSAREAMERGDMVYAGKYSQPDYEMIVSEGCSLAIENRMISHSPEVVEMLKKFEIPVVIDDSSFETHPLGRVEWIKFYGALLGKEEEAEKLFADQLAILKKMEQEEATGKTVVFFYLTSNGLVQVRESSDYIPKMIALAGGRYIFDDLGDPDSHRSTVNMQIEEFYDRAVDADFLIYNSSIDGGVASVEELLDKCALLEDFKAVKNGNVFCTTNDMYQQSMSIGYLMEDIHKMLLGKKEGMKYLFQLLEQEK